MGAGLDPAQVLESLRSAQNKYPGRERTRELEGHERRLLRDAHAIQLIKQIKAETANNPVASKKELRRQYLEAIRYPSTLRSQYERAAVFLWERYIGNPSGTSDFEKVLNNISRDIRLIQQDCEEKPKTEASGNKGAHSRGWAPNVGVFTSSSNGFSVGDYYVRAICTRLDSGASFEEAHDTAAMSAPVWGEDVITPEDSRTYRENGIDLPTGRYHVKPQKAGNTKAASFRAGKAREASQVLMIVGGGPGTDSSLEHAQGLQNRLEDYFHAKVTLLHRPTFTQLSKALKHLKSRGTGGNSQALVYLGGHGGCKKNDLDNGTWPERFDGTFSTRMDTETDYIIQEKDLRNAINRHIAPKYGSVTVVMDTCFAGSWLG